MTTFTSHRYTRTQAIDDGLLIDVGQAAQDVEIGCPTAISSTVWNSYVQVRKSASWQDERERLGNIMAALRETFPNPLPGIERQFLLQVQNDANPPRQVRLKAICTLGDNDETVLTVLMPSES